MHLPSTVEIEDFNLHEPLFQGTVINLTVRKFDVQCWFFFKILTSTIKKSKIMPIGTGNLLFVISLCFLVISV